MDLISSSMANLHFGLLTASSKFTGFEIIKNAMFASSSLDNPSPET